MLKVKTILLLSLLSISCSASNLPDGFHVLNTSSKKEMISLSELDVRARKFIASYWGKELDEISHLKLVDAAHRNDFDAIALTYQSSVFEPRVIVLFNKLGAPYKVMGYK